MEHFGPNFYRPRELRKLGIEGNVLAGEEQNARTQVIAKEFPSLRKVSIQAGLKIGDELVTQLVNLVNWEPHISYEESVVIRLKPGNKSVLLRSDNGQEDWHKLRDLATNNGLRLRAGLYSFDPPYIFNFPFLNWLFDKVATFCR